MQMIQGGVFVRDVEQTIREVNGTMAIEGMPLTDEDKNRIRDILHGRVSIDDVIRQLTEKHSGKAGLSAKQA
jgi:hypothetical protein